MVRFSDPFILLNFSNFYLEVLYECHQFFKIIYFIEVDIIFLEINFQLFFMFGKQVENIFFGCRVKIFIPVTDEILNVIYKK